MVTASSPSKRPARDELRAERDDDVGLGLVQRGPDLVGAHVAAQVDEHRLDPVGRLLQRGVAEVHALAEEGEAEHA